MGNRKRGLIREIARYIGDVARYSLARMSGPKQTQEGLWVPVGGAVGSRRAMQATAVYACVNVLSGTIGSLPVHLMERISEGERERAVRHPLYSILHDEPNSDMDDMLFKQIQQISAELRGVSYCWIERDRGARVLALWPLHPDCVMPKTEIVNGRKTIIGYEVRADRGAPEIVLPGEMLRVIGMSEDGIDPISPIKACASAINLSLEGEAFTERFFENDARPRGNLVIDGKIDSDPERARELKRQIAADYESFASGENRHRTAVLDNGMKYEKVSINPEDADVLEQRRFSVAEIAGRIYQVPLFMIGETTKDTSWGSGIAQQFTGFATYSLRNRVKRIERALNRSLLTERERMERRFYFEFLMDDLLRGDQKTLAEALHIARNDGIITGNEWRRMIGMNPAPPEVGDVFLVNGNMEPVDQVKIEGGDPKAVRRLGLALAAPSKTNGGNGHA